MAAGGGDLGRHPAGNFYISLASPKRGLATRDYFYIPLIVQFSMSLPIGRE